MDILNPECHWIENRCYRILPLRDSLRVNADEVYEPVHSTYIEEERMHDPDLRIQHLGNRFSSIIYVPFPLLRHVIGKKGKMIKILEQNGSHVKIPQHENIEAGITILGPTREIVSCTYYEIKTLVNNNRLKEEFTHFISFPMNSKEIQQSFMRFKKDILEKYKGSRNIDESIFQKPSKLHVTVAPLVLLDERDKQKAEAILTRCRERILKDFSGTQFVVQVKGVEYMNDDPAEVDVLYAKLHEQDGDTCIQVIADWIMGEFVDEKLAKDQHEKVKLHITLMNTLYRDRLEGQDNSETRRISFDARPILKDYMDYEFGQITINEIHISARYTESSDGYYIPTCKIRLN